MMTDYLDDLDSELKACAEENVDRLIERHNFWIWVSIYPIMYLVESVKL